MFLHLIDDSWAFNHFIRRCRLNDPGEHRFLVFTFADRILKVNPREEVSVFKPTRENCRHLARNLDNYRAVFIHNLDYEKSGIVLEAPTDVVFVWGVWGYDYYRVYPQFFRKLFLPYTRAANILLGKMSLSVRYLHFLVQPVTGLLGIPHRALTRQQAAARIAYTFNTMPRHSEVFKAVSVPRTHRFHMAYYSIEAITDGLDSEGYELGPHLLIGNSASNTSNHLDIFLKLRSHLRDQKVVTVLGYGSGRYRKMVNGAGRFLFGNRYQPLNTFLPLDLYNRVLLDCNVMIFNHRRAQALGNILFGVWAGHKIYLREENPVYLWLTDMGVCVFSIQSEWPEGPFTPLASEWRNHNRKIIEKHYSEAVLVGDLGHMLDSLPD